MSLEIWSAAWLRPTCDVGKHRASLSLSEEFLSPQEAEARRYESAGFKPCKPCMKLRQSAWPGLLRLAQELSCAFSCTWPSPAALPVCLPRLHLLIHKSEFSRAPQPSEFKVRDESSVNLGVIHLGLGLSHARSRVGLGNAEGTGSEDFQGSGRRARNLQLSLSALW